MLGTLSSCLVIKTAANKLFGKVVTLKHLGTTQTTKNCMYEVKNTAYT
jgi:hypothetical protein